MKTYKELQESITKALLKFGKKGIRKVKPNVFRNDYGKMVSKFNPDIDLKTFNRVMDLQNKYRNLNTDYKKALFMKQNAVGVTRGVDPFDTVSNLNKEPVFKRLARQGKPTMLDANISLQSKYTARRKDAMQGFKPTETGPNTAMLQTPPLSSGKGEKARKRALELMLKRIKK